MESHFGMLLGNASSVAKYGNENFFFEQIFHVLSGGYTETPRMLLHLLIATKDVI